MRSIPKKYTICPVPNTRNGSISSTCIPDARQILGHCVHQFSEINRQISNAMRICLLSIVVCLSALPAVPALAQDPGKSFQAVIDADGTQRAKILGGSYFFKPKHVIVKVNVPVELSVSLEPGIVPHTLVIKAAEAGIAIDESLHTDPATIAFTPRAVGKYPFYCKNKLLFFKSHREKGMEGILEVVE
ncbi:MAG: quinol oxidase [Gallionella sp.]